MALTRRGWATARIFGWRSGCMQTLGSGGADGLFTSSGTHLSGLHQTLLQAHHQHLLLWNTAALSLPLLHPAPGVCPCTELPTTAACFYH
jgi:hypothetical protein